MLGGEPGGGSPVTDGEVRLSVWAVEEPSESFLLDGEFAADGRARALLTRPITDLLESGRELRAMFVRTETYWYARAVSAPFPLTL